MAVRTIRFTAAVNASEVSAEGKCIASLQGLCDPGQWVVFAGLESSSSPLHQSDDLDLVLIGPRGVFLVEVKHWDAAWIGDNQQRVNQEADRLTGKARRLAGRIKAVLPNPPKVAQSFLLTREPAGPNLPQMIRGVPVWTLRDLAKILRSQPIGILDDTRAKIIAEALEPAAKLKLNGKVRRIANYKNLELLTPQGQHFHRVYRGIHQRTEERVILHLYDLSASEDKSPERQAERESRAFQMLQTTRFVPRVRDTLRDLPEFPGELCFFTLVDPGAPDLVARSADASWSYPERVQFAANSCMALQAIHELSGPEAVKIVHRNVCPQSVLVCAKNEPMFINFNLSRLPHTQTLGLTERAFTEYDAPEVHVGGLTAASQRSDVFSICTVLCSLFRGTADDQEREAFNTLMRGCAADPDTRASLSEIGANLRSLLTGKADSGSAFPNEEDEACVNSEYWCEGQMVIFRDMTLRILGRLGSGGVGRTFKVEQVDQRSGENYGTFVAKVMKAADSGRAALQAYQRVRSHSTAPGLSVVFETAKYWEKDRIVALLKWVEGNSLDGLASILPIVAEESGDDSVEELLIRWLVEVCQAIGSLHEQGLVHGDISPRNLIHDRGGLTLTDYDLVTVTGSRPWGVGASAYCSPEAQRREPLAPCDDLFALAASLFEVAFGHPAFSSPHGAIDKEHGLDWQSGEREGLPNLAAFFDRATHPVRERRFRGTQEALRALELIRGAPEEPVKNISMISPVQRSPQEVLWLNSLLRIYPGSPHGNIETRGLDSDFALATYVETPLEQALFESIRKRTTRLVILCGNAGDGKTALLQHLAGKFGVAQHQSADRIWEALTDDGLTLRAHLDGSASWQGRRANELLDDFLLPFYNGMPQLDISHLVAINDGRLYEWLEDCERARGSSPFTHALRTFLSDDQDASEAPDYIKFISLNHRSLVGGRTPGGEWSDDFLSRLIQRLLGGSAASTTWSPCLTCEAYDRCTAGPTAHKLLAAKGTPDGQLGERLRAKLSEALQAVHQRGQVHITTRELRGVLGYVLFGIRSCSELHENPELRPVAHWDMIFAPESPFRQGELLHELSALDPALESHPVLDKWLTGRTAREIPGAGPNYSGLQPESARRRAYFEWSESQLVAVTGDKSSLPLANGEHLQLFRAATLGTMLDNRPLCANLCRGISQLESLPPIALARQSVVPLRVTPRTPVETYLWVEKPLERFRLEADWPHIQDIPLPILPRRLKLVYCAANGTEDSLSMGYELFHTLLSLASGQQLSELRSDDFFANLALFTQRLAKEDEGHLLAWNPKSDSNVYRLGIQHIESRQVLACERIEEVDK